MQIGDHQRWSATLIDSRTLEPGGGIQQSDADLFASAFAEDAVYQLDEKGPVVGYEKMVSRHAEAAPVIPRQIKARSLAPTPLAFKSESITSTFEYCWFITIDGDESLQRDTPAQKRKT